MGEYYYVITIKFNIGVWFLKISKTIFTGFLLLVFIGFVVAVTSREVYETIDYNRLAYPNYKNLRVVFERAYVMVDETRIEDDVRKLYLVPVEYQYNFIIAEYDKVLTPTVVCFSKSQSYIQKGSWIKVSGTLQWRDWLNTSARPFLIVESVTRI